MKGVNSKKGSNGTVYWYARTDEGKIYCGKGEEGRALAEEARKKYEQDRNLEKMDSLGFKEQAQHYKKQVDKEKRYRTVKDLANWYMGLSIVQKKRGYKRETQALKHLLAYFGKMSAHKLKGSDTVKYRDKRIKQVANDNTVDLELSILRQIYRLAMKLDEITADYLPGSFVMNGTTNPRPIITDEQFELLHSNAAPVFADILLCGWESAMRSGEICNLKAKDVHLDVTTDIHGSSVSFIYLGIFDTKTGAERNVPVSDTLREMLVRRLQGLGPDDYVFTRKNGKPFNSTYVADMMRALCKRLGVPHGDKTLDKDGKRVGVVFHCLRHSRTSKWVEMGFNDQIIMKATGHKSLDAYRRYVKLNPSVVMRLVKTDNPNNFQTRKVSSL